MPSSASSSNRPAVQLLIQTAFLGDLLLGIPLMKKMKELSPEEPLVLLCRKGLGSLFLDLRLVDEVIEIRKGDRASYERALSSLAERSIARIVCCHESPRTAFFVRRLKSERKTGFRRWWNAWAFNERVVKNPQLPDPLRQLQLVESRDPVLAENIRHYAGARRAYLRTEGGQLSPAPAWASMGVRDRLEEMRPAWGRLMEKAAWSAFAGKTVICLFPGSVWATKRWTEEGFIETGRALQESGGQILVMGGPGEEQICSRVAKVIGGGARDLIGTTLTESALILAHADLVIANDSASAHLASAAETPTLAIFGPTVVEFGFRPWGGEVYIVDKQGLGCRPCGPHGHKKCPRGTHECMRNLAANEVIGRAREIL